MDGQKDETSCSKACLCVAIAWNSDTSSSPKAMAIDASIGEEASEEDVCVHFWLVS
jgi:hypothetical protein